MEIRCLKHESYRREIGKLYLSSYSKHLIMSSLYPLKFETIFKDKIWGGHKINSVLGKDYSPLPNCGETWEVSGVEGNISVVREGSLKGKNLKELIQEYGASLVGQRILDKYNDDFPLLIKFIDANDDLSVQVHPDDNLGLKRHKSFGKTEMWYIIQSDKGSKLITGFNQEMSREKYLDAFNSGKLMDILNSESTQEGDVFFLPAGRVHTIGRGNMIAEIQQTSDITYRIYDFDRKDASGNTRELHVDEALDAIDYTFYDEYKTRYKDSPNEAVELVSCPYFTTNKVELTSGNESIRNHEGLDCFRIYICLEGEGILSYNDDTINLSLGDAVLVPAEITSVTLSSSESGVKLLETYVTKM